MRRMAMLYAVLEAEPRAPISGQTFRKTPLTQYEKISVICMSKLK